MQAENEGAEHRAAPQKFVVDAWPGSLSSCARSLKPVQDAIF
jgi:hypothetical protein